MSKNIIDHDHDVRGGRAPQYSRLDRIKAGEAGHPNVKQLDRRRRKGQKDATRVKQFLRIERGYLA
ncbi:hypothetical protein [Pseudoruegeria sp. HB172150]|uniref:hypothetical protein n=1 Tax=Pseudoruegeria sp. HB172150 TaxID=2721164 RepID=UPI0015530C7F|nr:hypothetical protein [Pseudoruegeria sp. HB172150]